MFKDQLARLRMMSIGFVFQAYNLVSVLTVFENTAFVLELQGVVRGERIKRARKILAELGIEQYADQYPHRISGGEQQRVVVDRPCKWGDGEPRYSYESTTDRLDAAIESRERGSRPR